MVQYLHALDPEILIELIRRDIHYRVNIRWGIWFSWIHILVGGFNHLEKYQSMGKMIETTKQYILDLK